MDNEKKPVRWLKDQLRDAKFRYDYRRLDVMSAEQGNRVIAQMVAAGGPAMIARCGATEMRTVAHYLGDKGYPEKARQEILALSGVFPTDDATLDRFCEYYLDCLAQADLLALWGVGAEAQAVQMKCRPDTRYTRLRALEPYYFTQPWSAQLAGKRLLVVHPFADTIRAQYQKREKLFPGSDILPALGSLVCIPAVQSIAGSPTGYGDWFAALESMQLRIAAESFDAAIVGAGAYGLPLAAFIRGLGRPVVQMSGALQLLFGIKGRRWDEHEVISRMYNDAWVRPSAEETPSRAVQVEGGSYW